MAIEIVSFPINNGDFPYFFVCLPGRVPGISLWWYRISADPPSEKACGAADNFDGSKVAAGFAVGFDGSQPSKMGLYGFIWVVWIYMGLYGLIMKYITHYGWIKELNISKIMDLKQEWCEYHDPLIYPQYTTNNQPFVISEMGDMSGPTTLLNPYKYI